MKQIPIYDATAAVTCTIGVTDIPARLELVERMRATVASVERTDHGIVLRFAGGAAVETDVRQFAADEKRCCQFWGFEVLTDDGLALRWDGPPSAHALLDLLEAYFCGEGSIDKVVPLL